MTQIAAVSRLVRWFARQDELVQASVLRLFGDGEAAGDDELARVLHARMAGLAGGGGG